MRKCQPMGVGIKERPFNGVDIEEIPTIEGGIEEMPTIEVGIEERPTVEMVLRKYLPIGVAMLENISQWGLAWRKCQGIRRLAFSGSIKLGDGIRESKPKGGFPVANSNV